ncbi:hypothetical protein PIB30_042491 [Stylosanthes scabra]|uniref:Uncharacterized protein n=1 Tax=Stylosanthes scabra TaxID=79078 RepID=A0ABU6YFX7_9FABA|nr:hypothetical protein [Stylosanthes scabra]
MKFILNLEDDQENEILEMEVQRGAREDKCVMEVEDQLPTPSPKLVYEVVDTPEDIAISSLLTLLDLIDNVPEKFSDPGPCLVDCNVGEEDLKSSDKNITSMIDVAENVLLRIRNLTFLVDFHILDMPSNLGRPFTVLLGRPFLKTSHFKLNAFEGIYSFESNGDIVEFRLPDAIEDIPSEHSIFWCDVIKDVEVKASPKDDEKCLKVATHQSPSQAKKPSQRRRKKIKKKAKRSQEASVKKKKAKPKDSKLVDKGLKQLEWIHSPIRSTFIANGHTSKLHNNMELEAFLINDSSKWK